MTTLTQQEPITEGQLKLITRMIGDVADCDKVQGALKAISKEGAEKLKSNPEFVSGLRKFILQRIEELSIGSEVRFDYEPFLEFEDLIMLGCIVLVVAGMIGLVSSF